MEFDEVLKKRASIRKYSKKPVSFEDILKVCEAARFTPMAGNIFTLQLVLVSDEKTKQELANAALDQEFIADAKYIIVVCSKPKSTIMAYGERAKIYVRQQAGAAIQNMLLKITELGLASCWVGAFNEKKVKRILKIPEEIEVEALLPVSRPLRDVKPRFKPGLRQILHFEEWGRKFKEEVKPFA